MEEMVSLASYELLPTEELFPLFIILPEHGSLNDKFERLDYGYFYCVMVLGCIFLAFVWMISLYVIYLLLRICALRCNCARQYSQKMQNSLFWR